MTSLKEYQKRINDLAVLKGWSDDLHWLELGIFKEVGELQAEIERLEWNKTLYLQHGMNFDGLPAPHDRERTYHIERISKEFGDVIFFLFQAMNHFDIDLDKALELVIRDNTRKKKKTIDVNGKVVRK